MRYLDFLKRFTYTPNSFYDHLKGLEDAASGDVEINVLPAEDDKLEIEAGDMDGYEQEVTVQVVNDDGDVLEFYNGELNFQVVNDSTSGTVAINEEDAGSAGDNVDEDLSFENGELKVKLTYGGTWTENDTAKVNVDKDDLDIMGYAVKVENHDVLEVQA